MVKNTSVPPGKLGLVLSTNGGYQLSRTPSNSRVNLMPSSGPDGQSMHVVHLDTRGQNIHTHIFKSQHVMVWMSSYILQKSRAYFCGIRDQT